MNNTAHRIYLGARNTVNRAFSDRDVALVEAVLNDHFEGWTTAQATGCWQGRTEETLVITVTTKATKRGPSETAAAIELCARRLRDHLGQESVMLEQGGPVTFV